MTGQAERVVTLAARSGLSIACAESLTGGALCSALVAVPGASAVVRGGIVAYDADAKVALLGVPRVIIDSAGVVSHATAVAMARGAIAALGADVGVATTGVAGPEPHGGQAVGTVVVAVVTPAGENALTVHLNGDRNAIREASVEVALRQVERALRTFVKRGGASREHG